jgi:cell division septal protein FtsQ
MAGNGTRNGFLMFLILLICFAAIVFIGTEVFQVENIIVICSGALDENVIIGTSGISYGDNIFKINREQVKRRIEGNAPYPIVEGISINLPNKVHIIVEERVPTAVVPYLSSYILVDSSGFIMDITKQTQEPSYPVIEGISISRLTKGSTLEVAQDGNYKKKVLIRMLEALEQWNITHMIKTMYLDNPDDIILVTRDEIQVKLGQAIELDRKLGWLKSTAYTEVLQKQEIGTFDVSVPGKAVFHPQPLQEESGNEDQEMENGELENQEQLQDEQDTQDENEVTG